MNRIHRHARRFISGTKKPEEIGSYTLSRGTVGRKVFTKGWQHSEPRYPINIQERFHRTSVERVFHPKIVENVTVKEAGQPDTLEWRMHYETTSLDNALNSESNAQNALDLSKYKALSPWHDIPMGFICSNTNNLYFNFVNEISMGERAKLECATKEDWNPIKQDVKKGDLRYFKYGDLPFNYGFIPQTWEDPTVKSEFLDDRDDVLTGDNDPIDVVEISTDTHLQKGEVLPIKVIAVLGLIDEGETDWKIIGLRSDHPMINEISCMDDAHRLLGTDFSALILDWFENYKIPDGKPKNEFSHCGEYRDASVAIDIIEECHRQWYNLILGGCDDGNNHGLSLESVTHKYLVAQGLTNKGSMPELQRIEYPKLIDWKPRPHQKMQTIDHFEEEYDLNQSSPDQESKINNK